MIVDTGKHYLYRHIRLDTGLPFYIGIGTKRDVTCATEESYYERAFYKRGRGSLWTNIANKHGYEVEILLESDDYEFIKAKEIEFIYLYGKINKGGILSNRSDGGTGGKVIDDYSYREKTVFELDISTRKIIADYPSLKHAASSCKVSHKNISAVINKTKKSVSGKVFSDISDSSKIDWEFYTVKDKRYEYTVVNSGCKYLDKESMWGSEFTHIKLESFKYMFKKYLDRGIITRKVNPLKILCHSQSS